MMRGILDARCKTPLPGVYYEDGRAEIYELIERIINQNEQTLGLFYLEPDGDLKLAVGAVALLRVTIALRAQHYEDLKNARIGRLKSPFRNKLGWLAGNLFSRVDTPDWPEEIGKKEADKKVEKIFKDIDEAAENIWVPRQLLDTALATDQSINDLPRERLAQAIHAYAPKAPHLEALGRVKELAPPLLDLIAFPDLKAAAEQVKASRAYSRLIADAITGVLRATAGSAHLFDLAEALHADARLPEAASLSLSALTAAYMRERGPKTYDKFFDIYMSRPLLDAALLEIVRQHAVTIGIGAEAAEEALPALRALTPTDSMQEYIKLLLQSLAARSLPGRLASSLNNDPTFAAAFINA